MVCGMYVSSTSNEEGVASHHHVSVRPFTASGFHALLRTTTNDILSFYLCHLWGRRQAAPFVCPIASLVEPDSFMRISNVVQLRCQRIST